MYIIDGDSKGFIDIRFLTNINIKVKMGPGFRFLYHQEHRFLLLNWYDPPLGYCIILRVRSLLRQKLHLMIVTKSISLVYVENRLLIAYEGQLCLYFLCMWGHMKRLCVCENFLSQHVF